MIATVSAVGLCTVQDGGRRGYEAVGVPISGAWHRGRYAALAHVLTGAADPTYPALELVGGFVVLDMEATVECAVSGPSHVHVDGRPAPVGAVIRVDRGQQLSVQSGGDGPVYVGINGWSAPRTLGSCATDTFSRLGGVPVQVGDALKGSPVVSGREGWFLRPELSAGGPFRLIVSATDLAREVCGREWRAATTSRSGTRLQSESVVPASGLIDSFPVLPGAVQVTPQGEAIILGPDGGLTGGYPVVGVLADVDRDRVSTILPGQPVRFAEIAIDAAVGQFEADQLLRRRRVVDPSLLA